jgi:hypothetical protein
MPESEITKLKLQMNNLDNKLGNVEDKIDNLTKKFDDFLNNVDDSYAGKWTEKLLIFVGSAVGLAVIGAIMALIFQNPNG